MRISYKQPKLTEMRCEKRLSLIVFYILTLFCQELKAQPLFQLSKNIYRVPYLSGITVHVTNDHLNHDPIGRYDMSGTSSGSSCSINYPIVAAAEGIIRRIVDNHDTSPPDCDPNCQDFNNYVWIEHANGEWSKYTHMMKNSTRGNAGLSVGDQVCAGTLLGYECEVGQASGPHLHFEVRRPNDSLNIQIQAAGGFMTDAAHVIPVVNSIGKHYFDSGDDIVASSSSSCTNTNVTLSLPMSIGRNSIAIYMASGNISTSSSADFVFQNGSNGLFHAGGAVTLVPGFRAAAGSSMEARIGSCATTNMVGVCQ